MSDFERAAKKSIGANRPIVRCRGCRGAGVVFFPGRARFEKCEHCKGAGRS